MPTNFGRTDQELEWSAEPATLAGDDLVMNLFLRRGHLGGADLTVTAHLRLLIVAGAHDREFRSVAGGDSAHADHPCDKASAKLQRINPGERRVSHGRAKSAAIPLSHIALFAAGVSTHCSARG